MLCEVLFGFWVRGGVGQKRGGNRGFCWAEAMAEGKGYCVLCVGAIFWVWR